MSKEYKKVALSEVLQLSIDAVPVDNCETYPISGVYSYGRGLFARQPLSGTQTTYKFFHKLHENDFVLSQLKGWEGALAKVTLAFEGWFLSPQFATFRVIDNKLDINFLDWYCKQSKVWEELKYKSSGMGARRDTVSPKKFLSIEIPHPPLDEQQRIVARIEELAAKVEEARGLRRQSAEEAEALFNAGKNDLFNEAFTHQWESMALGDIADIRSGVTLGRKLQGATITLPYLRVANVQDGYLDLKSIKKVEIMESEIGKWQLQFGDLLLTEGGDWDKLGRGTVWHGEISNCIHQNHIFRVRVNQQEFAPHYLSALIGSPYGKAYFQAASKQTTNLATINHRQLKAFRVFKPPLPEQHRIVGACHFCNKYKCSEKAE